MRVVLILLLTAAIVSGCIGMGGVTSGSPAIVDQSKLAMLQENVTMKMDAQNMFGEPQFSDFQGENEVWKYQYTKSSVTPFGGKSDIKNLTLMFDKDGKLLRFTKGGMNVQ